MDQQPRTWYGPIAMQRRRLAHVEALIEEYTRLTRESGNPEKFRQALQRALLQKLRIQSWLDIHEKRTREPTEASEKARIRIASMIFE